MLAPPLHWASELGSGCPEITPACGHVWASFVKPLEVEQRCLLHPREAADAGWLLEGEVLQEMGAEGNRSGGLCVLLGAAGCQPEPALH